MSWPVLSKRMMRRIVYHAELDDQLRQAELEFPRIEEFLAGLKQKLCRHPEFGTQISGHPPVWFVGAPDLSRNSRNAGDQAWSVAARAATSASGELNLWAPLFGEVAYFERAKFHFIRGSFPGEGHGALRPRPPATATGNRSRPISSTRSS